MPAMLKIEWDGEGLTDKNPLVSRTMNWLWEQSSERYRETPKIWHAGIPQRTGCWITFPGN
jgi:hypothetical protein